MIRIKELETNIEKIRQLTPTPTVHRTEFQPGKVVAQPASAVVKRQLRRDRGMGFGTSTRFAQRLSYKILYAGSHLEQALLAGFLV